MSLIPGESFGDSHYKSAVKFYLIYIVFTFIKIFCGYTFLLKWKLNLLSIIDCNL